MPPSKVTKLFFLLMSLLLLWILCISFNIFNAVAYMPDYGGTLRASLVALADHQHVKIRVFAHRLPWTKGLLPPCQDGPAAVKLRKGSIKSTSVVPELAFISKALPKADAASDPKQATWTEVTSGVGAGEVIPWGGRVYSTSSTCLCKGIVCFSFCQSMCFFSWV